MADFEDSSFLPEIIECGLMMHNVQSFINAVLGTEALLLKIPDSN